MALSKNTSSSLQANLDSYLKSSKSTLLKKSVGSASVAAGSVAAFAVGTTDAEAVVTVMDLNIALSSNGATDFEVVDIPGFGIAEDFEFQLTFANGSSDFFEMGDRASTRVIGRQNAPYAYASRLSSGATIPGALNFLPDDGAVNSTLAYVSTGTSVGDWAGGATGFIGFEITTGTDINYGWLQVRLDAGHASGEIISYGIETTPNTPITIDPNPVPEPSSLSYLAVGGAGVLAWRRRRKSAE